MREGFRIGEVERLTGLKQHTIRHWEQNLSLFSPGKGPFGRHQYSITEIGLLFRLDYLVHARGLRLGRACEIMLNERSARALQEWRAAIDELRDELVELLVKSRLYWGS